MQHHQPVLVNNEWQNTSNIQQPGLGTDLLYHWGRPVLFIIQA